MMEFCAADVFERRDDALSTSLGEELVFLSVSTSSYFATGRVGMRIWELLAQPSSLREIATALGNEYSVDTSTCEHESAAFLRQLLDAGLVRLRP